MTPETSLLLVPAPKKVERTSGLFHPSRPLLDAIHRYDRNHGPVPGVQIIVGRSVSDNGSSASDNGSSASDNGSSASDNGSGPERLRDSYDLEIEPTGITIRATEPQGAFYGMMTLRQVLRHAAPDHVPCLRIRDWPDFPNRGIMLDISRDRVPAMETLYRLVDFWSELKINQIQLYTEHTFAYKAHRTVWENSSPMMPDEIRALDLYCADRFIELIPNQNSFGHMERWLSHSHYLHLAEAPEGFSGWNGVFQREPFSLSPAVEESIPFLAGLYDELLPNFTSGKFNVGCDETIDLGQGRSAELCRATGTGRVYLDFVRRVSHLVKERGKTMLYWGDVILHYPQLIRELPHDAIALTWGYERDHPFEKDCDSFKNAGVIYHVCAGTSAWNSLGGRWENAKENLERAARIGLGRGAVGFLTTEWGDNGHLQQYPVALPGYLYGAALSWSVEASRNLPVADALSRHLFGDSSGALARALLDLGDATSSIGVRLHNATILAAMIIDPQYPYYRERYGEFAETDFLHCRTIIGQALSAAHAFQPGDDEASRIKAEVEFTARIMLHACDLAESRLSGGVREISEIKPDKRATLAADLSGLVPRYRELWLERCRPGGLEESAGRLEELLKLYRA